MTSSIKLIVKLSVFILILSVEITAQQDTTLTTSEKDTVFVMQKSPWGAVLRSAIIPGWGQIYNESYFKAVVIWGIGAWLGYGWYLNNKDYERYQDYYELTGNDIYLRQRDIARDNRDLFTIYLVFTYILNLVDAYVDAHLFDFNVEEDFFTGAPMLNLKLKIF